MNASVQQPVQPQQKKEPPPFMFCVEAILGLTLKGQPVTEESVKAWLEVVFAEDQEKIPQVLRHAKRILNGPVAAPK